MPKTVYLFDVDGTLTPPLTEIDEIFADVFLTWMREKEKLVYLVTGSDITKTKKQIFPSFIDQCEGIFTCSGNVFYSKGNKIYENVDKSICGIASDDGNGNGNNDTIDRK